MHIQRSPTKQDLVSISMTNYMSAQLCWGEIAPQILNDEQQYKKKTKKYEMPNIQ
jgi:hypothetical protein